MNSKFGKWELGRSISDMAAVLCVQCDLIIIKVEGVKEGVQWVFKPRAFIERIGKNSGSDDDEGIMELFLILL